MSSDYWFGLATIPAVLILLALGVLLFAVLFQRTSWDSVECLRCDHEHNTNGPWWLLAIRIELHNRTHRKDAR